MLWGKICHFEFTFSVITIVLVILSLKFGMGKFFGVRNPKITPRILKNKPVLRYLRFQVLDTYQWTGAKKYMRPDR